MFNGVTQTVSVVIGRVDTPAEKEGKFNRNTLFWEKMLCSFCFLYFIYTIHLLSDDAVCILFGMPLDPSFHPPWPSSSWGWPLPQQTGPSSSSQTAPATLRWVGLSTVIEEHYGLSAPRLSDGTHTRDPWRRRKEMSQTPSVHQQLHILHILHSPANKIHSKVIELVKIVGSVCDGIRFVACVSKTVIRQWLHECRECAQEHQNIYAHKTYPATPPYPWWQWSISPLPSQDLCHHTSGSKFHYLPMREHNV